jgi:hypothetical protein
MRQNLRGRKSFFGGLQGYEKCNVLWHPCTNYFVRVMQGYGVEPNPDNPLWWEDGSLMGGEHVDIALAIRVPSVSKPPDELLRA